MTLPRKLMIDGEQTVTTTRTHVKVLFVPVRHPARRGRGRRIPGGAGRTRALRAGSSSASRSCWPSWGAVIPFLRWFLWTYTLTNKRIVEQKGILTRTGRVIPLSRINDVAFEKNLNDRILGCGTLVIHDASEQAGLELRDIPHIEALHRTVTGLVDQAHRTSDESI